eukprot:TRINITY_DN392_c1_g1_i1.p1 TRINITY_DN392_c1_g1~~TRINITY_DN392_c1_g1_i1.p1  ORF type:complete len:182 (-),score=35.54 TRINITY_DN392_c1_g1_i1:201-746(-)
MLSSLAFAVALANRGVAQVAALLAYSIAIDFFVAGLLISTLCWWLSNTYLRLDIASTHTVPPPHGPYSHSLEIEQKVEWLYAFDVHCNSYFLVYLILYVVQYLLLPVVLLDGYLVTALANSLYLAAVAAYFYSTFRGYEVLPFLEKTERFLFPAIGAVVAFLVLLPFNVNMSSLMMGFYFS